MNLQSVAQLCPDPSVINLPVIDKGWNSEKPEFAQIVQAANPKLIVEIGVFTGQGTLRLAALAPEAKIISIDVFLGSQEHLMNDEIPSELGFPLLYRQFIKNVAVTPYANRIFPFPSTSRVAARFIAKLEPKPGLIYIDGNHDCGACYEDIMFYYPLLADGGIIFGDDFNVKHAGVPTDVIRYALERNLKFDVMNEFWVMRKGA